MAVIDFNSIMQSGTTMFSGKEKGVLTRKHFDLDALDNAQENVEVSVPDEIDVLTPSFVTGMFSKSAKSLGSVDAFFDKYKFKASVNVLRQVAIGIESSLVTGNAFSK